MIPKTSANDRLEAEVNIQGRKPTTLRSDVKTDRTTSEILSSLHQSEIREQLVHLDKGKCSIEAREEVSSDGKCLDERDDPEERNDNICSFRFCLGRWRIKAGEKFTFIGIIYQ